MFVILQKYDFSSKSQQDVNSLVVLSDVCDTAKVRFFKQITTLSRARRAHEPMFVILQKYDFSSKSQLRFVRITLLNWCLWYCKSTIFQANHNFKNFKIIMVLDVCDTAKVRFFKQITTLVAFIVLVSSMFVILQKYDFSSKSQQRVQFPVLQRWCLWYCKSTIFQANHN